MKNYFKILAKTTLVVLTLTACTSNTNISSNKIESSVEATSSTAESTTKIEESSSIIESTSTDSTTESNIESSTENPTESTTETSTEDPTTEEPTAEPTEESTEKSTTEPVEDPTSAEPTIEPTTEEPTVETTPVKTTPVETQPTTQIVETTPAPTTKPVETTPIIKPVETKPVETTVAPTTKPAETTVAPTTKPIEVKATSISAKANGSYYVGDTLKSSDFTITVKMSDGSTKTNPAGFSVSPLKLSSTKNTLTASYGGVSTTFTVNATQKAAATPTTAPTTSDNLGTTYTGDEMCAYIYHHFIEVGKTRNGGGIEYSTVYTYGNPYVCSTFVQAVFKQFGMDIPSDLNALYNLDKTSPNVKEVSLSEAKTGDILVSNTPFTSNGHSYTGHCGIVGFGGMYDIGSYPGVALVNMPSGYKVLRFSGNTLKHTLNTEDGNWYYDEVRYKDVPNNFEITYTTRNDYFNYDVTHTLKVDKSQGLVWEKCVEGNGTVILIICSAIDENFDMTFNKDNFKDIDGTKIEDGEYDSVIGCYSPNATIYTKAAYPQYIV